jgi:hypothetical protein
MYIYISYLLKCKIHLYLYDSVRGYLHYYTVEFEL